MQLGILYSTQSAGGDPRAGRPHRKVRYLPHSTSCSLSSKGEGSWCPVITVVSGLLHSGAFSETETEAGRWVKCTNGLNTQCSDTGAPDSPHFRLLSSAFVEAVPSSRKLFVASLSISYLIYKAQCLGEILSDLLA